ncbi:MAG: glucokinase [Alphaproteobacteria bacterium]|nr:glucokinase [Alphaproteobacteria bacterium]
MKILADIGGTYARFAKNNGQTIESYKKYKVTDFKSFEAALTTYIKENNNSDKIPIMIATAAYPDNNGIWNFINQNKWKIDLTSLTSKGWAIELILNDFEAAVWGLLTLKEKDIKIFKSGEQRNKLSKCLIGPGTGLGLGYLINNQAVKTHGGHMLATNLTQEHYDTIKAIEQIKDNNQEIVFENLISGSGLMNIYRAQCLIHDRKPIINQQEMLLENLDNIMVKNTLRLFHEFFGLFAHTVIITGHAYGGLYLTGGILDKLIERNVFDFKHFEQFFILKGANSVMNNLNKTPIIYIKEPYLALRGLLAANEQNL